MKNIILSFILMLSLPSNGTTFKRADIKNLVKNNQMIFIVKVIGENSKWNELKTFLETDVQLAIDLMIKGDVTGQQIKITLMGGTYEEVTHLIVGGAELIAGRDYLLFVNKMTLPGNRLDKVGIPEHAQGVFEIVNRGGELYAISQANGSHLIDDNSVQVGPFGGSRGVLLDEMIQMIQVAMREGESG